MRSSKAMWMLVISGLISLATAHAEDKPTPDARGPVANPHAPAGYFIAIGGINTKEPDGHEREAEFGTVHLSRDGESWENVFKGGCVTEQFNHANNNLLRCLAYGNGVFVVVGNAKNILVSRDARKWELADAPHGAFSVDFGNGRFIAPTAGEILVSTEGVKWTKHTPKLATPVWGKDGAGHVRKTVFGNGVFVCVGEQRVSVTKDGESWLHHEVIAEDKRPGQFNLAFGIPPKETPQASVGKVVGPDQHRLAETPQASGRFIWLREKQPHVSSIDGIKWEPIAFPDADTGKPSHEGLWTGTQFLVRGKDCFYESADGVTWIRRESKGYGHPNAVGAAAASAASNPGLMVASNWPAGFRVSSDNGRTWKQIKTDIAARRVYFFDGKQVVGQNGG